MVRRLVKVRLSRLGNRNTGDEVIEFLQVLIGQKIVATRPIDFNKSISFIREQAGTLVETLRQVLETSTPPDSKFNRFVDRDLKTICGLLVPNFCN